MCDGMPNILIEGRSNENCGRGNVVRDILARSSVIGRFVQGAANIRKKI
jgi:hypothetical protein